MPRRSAPTTPMAPGGGSEQWESSLANQRRIGDMCLEWLPDKDLAAEAGAKWDKMPPTVACDPRIYGFLATFLADHYVSPSGGNKDKHLSFSTAIGVWGGLIAQAQTRFSVVRGLSEEHRDFFKCVAADNSAQAIWYRKMKDKLNRVIWDKETSEGKDNMDHSASPIYPFMMKDMMRALAKANTFEAYSRKLALFTSWAAIGRSGEVGNITWDALRWDPLHKCVIANWRQQKSAKFKVIIFIPGVDRHADWFMHLADYLISRRGEFKYKQAEASYILPEVQGNGAGAKLTSYIKALQEPGKRGAIRAYNDVCVKSLPAEPTAAGIRPGGCDTCAVQGVPAEILCHASGHDLTGIGALFNYLGVRIPLVMSSAVCLSGWQPFPRGQIERGPVPASLQPLIDSGISASKLNEFMDDLFILHDDSPPMLRIGGSMRPMVEACTATLIMHFEERFDAGEANLILQRMRDSFHKVGLPRDKPQDVFITWGKLIKQHFIVNNVHRTAPSSIAPANEQMISSIQSMGQMLGKVHQQMMEQNLAFVRQQQLITSLQMQISQLKSYNVVMADPDPADATLDATIADLQRQEAEEGHNILRTPGPPQPRPQPNWGDVLASDQPSASTDFGPLVHDNGTGAGPDYSLKGVTVARLFIDYCANACNRPLGIKGADKSRADTAIEWCEAMATKEEKTILVAPEQRNQAIILNTANTVASNIQKRLKDAYDVKGLNIGRDFFKNTFKVSTLEEKLKSVTVHVSRGLFQAWRRGESPPQNFFQQAKAKRPRLEQPSDQTTILLDSDED